MLHGPAMTMDNHPTTRHLQAFALGKLDPDESAAVEAHMEVCPACAEVVRATPPDAFVRKLRTVRRHGEAPPSA
jgi:anti-sigma factor RsiW